MSVTRAVTQCPPCRALTPELLGRRDSDSARDSEVRRRGQAQAGHGRGPARRVTGTGGRSLAVPCHGRLAAPRRSHEPPGEPQASSFNLVPAAAALPVTNEADRPGLPPFAIAWGSRARVSSEMIAMRQLPVSD